MADVRSLLRQERAVRQQTTRPKTSAAPAAAPSGRKRKANDDDIEERKRNKTDSGKSLPAGFFDEDAAVPGIEESVSKPESLPTSDPVAPAPAPPVLLNADEEAELAAFERELEAPPPEPSIHTFTTGAVIQSAPMTAEELAAQAREEQSAQRTRREAELADEKEDAARQLEEEFEAMESLEQRTRRLREKREALRLAVAQSKAQDAVLPDVEPVPSDDEDSDEEDDDWDAWRFRAA